MAFIGNTLSSLFNHDDKDPNPLTLSDEQISEEIYTTHVHSDIKLDVDSLFSLSENILERSTHIVDNVVQGTNASLEHFDDKIPPASFSSPLCTLKQIAAEMSCKPPGEKIAHKTTLAILNKLSHYAWDAKAVLTLAAFALEYGDFSLLAKFQPTDPLAKSVAILKRVPALTRPTAVQKHRQYIVELNSLIKATLQVIELIFELENFPSYDPKDVPALGPAEEKIPVDVYWAIITIVAIVSQIDSLTTDWEHKQELSHFGQKINIVLSKLRQQITVIKQQIEQVEYRGKLRKLLQTPIEIVEVFKAIIFPKDVPQPLFDGSTKTTVEIDVLKQVNVFFFISTLEITDHEIEILRPVYNHIKTDKKYKIVWLPLVEEWNETSRKKFELLKTKMPWLVVQHFGSIAGFKFIKEDWNFKKKPMVVVLSPQGKVQHSNAFHLIESWGLKAFPFTIEAQESLDREIKWVGPVVSSLHSDVDRWVKEEKYVFFYGGHDKEWIQQFSKAATALANDTVIKEQKISLELFHVDKENKSLLSKFWSGIESLFVTKVHKTVDTVTQEVQKLLSYKNETGWALLSKGSAVVVSGHATSILKTVTEFEKWKGHVPSMGFEVSLKEYHEKIVRATHRCLHLEIPNVAGKLPETINCPDCPRTMEIFISYKCCHNESTANGIH
ncbi:hypothetical protein L6164_025770 [Bauhinia variegata]|uniref:Uncharacterized protein n=1 Tax=Bauhinia variegata TaxID=167791 RepID=A0ACB9M3H6_BAUVA|nr:hypothetical protein L6164_025770 [Bauhinia variegata]